MQMLREETCSAATTLRDRRDEWIEIGIINELREAVLEAYDRLIGLEPSEVAVKRAPGVCLSKEPGP